MKIKKKSHAINYERIYQACAIAAICFLSYVIIAFFLSMSHFISVFLLFASIIFLILHLLFKLNPYLIASFACCILCLISNIYFIYLQK